MTDKTDRSICPKCHSRGAHYVPNVHSTGYWLYKCGTVFYDRDHHTLTISRACTENQLAQCEAKIAKLPVFADGTVGIPSMDVAYSPGPYPKLLPIIWDLRYDERGVFSHTWWAGELPSTVRVSSCYPTMAKAREAGPLGGPLREVPENGE